jgi:anti-sigma B factor antagonist
MQNPSASGPENHVWVAPDDAPGTIEPGRLTVQLITDGRCVALRLEGELDLETSPEFDRRLAAIDQAQISRLLIDLAGVTFMDSRGLSSIVRAHQSAEANGHTLVVRRGSNQVQRLFALTSIDERLTFED